ncbi:excitatory amino acid transporter 1-like isoform X2 [Ostrea edulis]|uniref:excitatory amino acid transporter 1-like isoform X2 n=1 Tax=Ostrea edulis TaxID=37623 RepID=UPI0024AF3D55|nr:excitatory amino acid transporter 1-like isoform X2 [Ostrea edulis]
MKSSPYLDTNLNLGHVRRTTKKKWMAGELYLRMLKSMIVPLIVSSVITGTASMDPKSNGKVSAVCFLYIIFTNMMPTIIGSVLVIAIKPGEGVADSKSQYNLTTNLETQDIFADLLRNLVPVNLVSATFEQAQTKYSYEKVASNKSGNVSQTTIVSKSVGSAPSSNILGLVIVSAVFGLATSHMQDVGYPFKQFFSSATEIILRILRWLIWSTPVGVLSLIAKTMAGSQNLEDDMRKLGVYFGTVMTGLLICGFIIQPITYFIVCRKNPFVFWFSILQPTMIVFATSSTAIAIPESYECLEEKNSLDRRVTRFVVPLSAALGRCGSSMYITVSCLFVAQLVDIEVDFSKVVVVCILTTFSTLAVPSVTGASLITVIILLTALNIPAEAASLLFALEWFLDRFRSVVNYYIQTLGVVITFEKCKSSLTSCEDKLDVDQEQTDAIVSVPDGDIPKNFERTTQEQSHL